MNLYLQRNAGLVIMTSKRVSCEGAREVVLTSSNFESHIGFMDSSKKLHLISNHKSGQGKGQSMAEIARTVCEQKGWELVSHEAQSPRELDGIIDQAIEAALKDGGRVAAAGGDGTLRAVVEKVYRKNLEFAAIPCGTFNFFARTHSIPLKHEQAVEVAISGERREVRLGDFSGRIFLVNASLGLYAQSIREREKNTKRWGRKQIVVIFTTLMSLLKGHRLMSVELITELVRQTVKTSMIFIGNNSLQLRDVALQVAKCMKDDKLAMVHLRPLNLWRTLVFIFHGLTKTLENEQSLETSCVDSLVITTREKKQMVALDGEIFTMNSPFTVTALPKALRLMVPTEEQRTQFHAEERSQ